MNGFRAAATAALLVATLPAMAAGPGWTLPERPLPPPDGTSPELREAVLALPAPDVAAARQRAPASDAEWREAIASVRESRAENARTLARSLQVSVREETMAGVRVYRLTPARVAPAHRSHLFLALHGGAYVFGGGLSGITEGVIVAARIGIPVVSVDYRMPPDHPFPAAVDDAVAVYRALLKDHPPAAMAVGGTSAGGGLTLAALLKFRELGLPLPGAFYAGTPWSDLTATGDTYHSNEGADHILVTYPGLLEAAAKLYAAGRDLKTPLLSPVYGDLSGFPPGYLVTGTRDLFLSNTARVHRLLREAGVEAELNVYEGFAHADYLFMLETPESKQVFVELDRFLQKHLE